MVDKGFPAKGLEDLRCRAVQGLAGYNLVLKAHAEPTRLQGSWVNQVMGFHGV